MPPAADDFKLIRTGLLIDGLGGPPIERGAVLTRGSTIVAVGRQQDVAAPEGARVHVLDHPSGTVMPGMVDCHTHHNGFGDGRAGDDLATLPDEVLALQSARNARASLFTGVTTIRENGPKNVHDAAAPRCSRPGHHRRAADGPLRQARLHHRRPHGVLRLRGDRSGRGPRDGQATCEGGRGLHQDHRHRRQHPHLRPRSGRPSTWTS